MVLEIERDILAYWIVGVVAAAAIPVTLVALRRRRREKLRRRGIKTHGH